MDILYDDLDPEEQLLPGDDYDDPNPDPVTDPSHLDWVPPALATRPAAPPAREE